MRAGWQGTRWGWLAAVACAHLVLGGACGLVREEEAFATPDPPPPNVLVNGGFEFGAGAWAGLPPPQATRAVAYAGAAALELRTDEEAAAAGATQAMMPAEFPQFVSGFYRVESWPDDGPALLSFTITVTGADGALDRIRFVLGASEQASATVQVSDTVFLNRDRPERGRWMYFGYPLWEAWIAWRGQIPVAWQSIDISVIVEGPGIVAQFDELYAGPQVGNPNRPAD